MDFTVGECNREIECLRTEQRLPELGGVRELHDFTVPRKPATKSSLLEVQSFRGPSSDLWTVQQWTFHRSTKRNSGGIHGVLVQPSGIALLAQVFGTTVACNDSRKLCFW